jgi:hypothetical protein
MLRSCLLTLLALLVCCTALAAACWLYPGGSWTELDAHGFSLLRNFWCDLLRSHAINGRDNFWSKQLASLGFAALGLGLWPYWAVAASLLDAGRRGRVRLLGFVSAGCLWLTALLPSDRHPVLHGVVALGGAVLGMLAAFACVGARLPAEARYSLRRISGWAAFSLALLNALLYVHVAYAAGTETLLHPSVQKFATAALFLWMLSTVRVVACRLRGSG